MSALHDEPTIPPRLRRPLAAVWISLGLHAAVISLLQVSPPMEVGAGAPVIEARLVTQPDAAVAESEPSPPPEAQTEAPPPPVLAPSEAAEPLPVAPPDPQPPVQPAAAVPPGASTPAEAPGTPRAQPSEPAPAASLSSAVDLTFYSARDLDVQPRALREIVPEYPEEADRQRLSGKVRLQLKLEADGRVSDVEVVSALPPGRFEESALRAFREARFAPAQKNGRPVRAKVLIEVEYDWEGQR